MSIRRLKVNKNQTTLVWLLVLFVSISSLCTTPIHAAEDTPSLDANISLDFNGAELKNVLKVLSRASGVNIIPDQQMHNKTINLFLENVSIREAMDIIASSNEIHYVKEPSGVYMFKNGARKPIVENDPKPFQKELDAILQRAQQEKELEIKKEKRELVTQIFFLRYQRLSTSPIDVGGQSVIGELGSSGSGSSSSSGSGSSSSDSGSSDLLGLGGGSSGGESSGGGSASTAPGIDTTIASLLSSDGKMSVNLPTNSMIVTDYVENLELIQRILDGLDVYPRQVMLEVQVLEVGASTISNLGVDIGGSDGALVNFVGGSRTASFPLQESIFNSFDATTGAKAAVTLGTLSFANFQAVLKLILTDSETEIIANPRVLTMNNEAAVIQLSTETSIAKVTEQASSEGVSLTSTDTAERSETGIILKMTPQINLDDSVVLYLEPSISTVSASTFFSTDFLDPTTRSIRTTVQVMNHETIVIGGLIDSSSSVSVKKVPIFGDIPLLGKLFQYTSETSIDRELLIFITPHIIEPPSKKAVESVVQAEFEPTNLEEILAELEVEPKPALLNSNTTVLPKGANKNQNASESNEATEPSELVKVAEVTEVTAPIEASESEISQTVIVLDKAIDQSAEAEFGWVSQRLQAIHGEVPLLKPSSELAGLGKVVTRRATK
ncbi:MAG: MSHA biogenesis protein MshL [Candidatus Omnitrophota bacterium]|jgi:MSHA biogenesis protein MshL